jgi:hypothetical protein
MTMGLQDRLWDELASEQPEALDAMSAHPALFARAERRRLTRPAVLASTGTGVAAATAAVVVALGATGAAPAFAVTTNPDGTVTVTLSDIAAISGVNAELAADGINARAIPVQPGCQTQGLGFAWPSGTDPNSTTVTLDPKDIPTGYTAIVAVDQESSGRILMTMGSSPSPGPSCIGSITAPEITPSSSAPAGNSGQ